jgi:hypothetical protein
MPTLHDRALDQLIPEPVWFKVDSSGNHSFAVDDLPWRAIIDVRGGLFFPGINPDGEAGTVTITANGRTAVYRRRGYDIHGAWICDLDRQP